MRGLGKKERENALNEVRILASISHKNVIGYKEAFYDESTVSLCIVLEYADGGDLLKKIEEHKRNGTFFNETEIWSFFLGMLKGVHSLHEGGIVHRDIKAANVFLNKQGEIKLGDLNVSKVCQAGALMFTQTGTPYYACPEVWQDKPYDSRSDIWSLGCILYEMCALRPPFMAKDMRGLYNKVVKGVFPSIPCWYSDDIANVISLCLQVAPLKRPTAEQLLRKREVVLRLNRDDFIPPSSEGTNLLDTIRCPQQLRNIGQVLPKSNYNRPTKSRRETRRRRLNSSSDSRSTLSSARMVSRSIDKARLEPLSVDRSKLDLLR